MRFSIRRLVFAALLGGVVLVALGCSGGKKDEDGGGSSPSSSQADLRLLGSDPITLDPAIAGDAGSAQYIVEIFSGLVMLDKNLQIQPDLAESWDVSGDGTVYTFHIRKNAMFYNGRAVTADDFKYSLDRTALLGQTDSATAEAYLGDIVGAKEVTRGRAKSITGVEVVDSSTLRITIDAPKAYFLAKLTFPTAFVVDKQQTETNPRNWTRNPNGTGPYHLKEFRLNERIILEANEKHYAGAPSIKRVLYILSGGSSLTQYENGEIDLSGIGTNDIERVQSSRDALNKDYKSGPVLSIGYVGFNTKFAPFDDPLVRLAFVRAVDREELVKVIDKNLAPVANSIMMPGLPGYNANAKVPSFDPAAAKDLLAQSKYKDARSLPKITLTQVGGGATADVEIQRIVENWKQVLGVDVQIAQSEAASFFDDLDRGRMQMFAIGWIMDYPDPENIIDLLFHSKSRQNNTGYSSPEVDALVEQARVEQDVTRRLQLYQRAEGIILNDAPWMPLTFGYTHLVVKPYVKGYTVLPGIVQQLRYLSIEK